MLSVIIPLGPADNDPTPILQELTSLPEDSEIILAVSNGFKLKGTLPNKIRFVEGRSGRASQMNSAARQAMGEFIWFLHADSKLGENAISKLISKLDERQSILLYHDLAFSKDGPWLMKFNAMAVRFRSDFLKIPFGDQGFCVSRDLFFDLGGYDETAPYGEDHLFVWKARQTEVKLMRTGGTIFTSARKYEKGGWAKVTALHVWLTIKQAMPELLKLIKGKIR